MCSGALPLPQLSFLRTDPSMFVATVALLLPHELTRPQSQPTTRLLDEIGHLTKGS